MTEFREVKVNDAAMAKRVAGVIRRATKARFITKVGNRYRMGQMTREGFDMETVVEGEPPVMLPDGHGQTDLLELGEVRFQIKATLIRLDVAEELGVPADRVVLRWYPDSGWHVAINQEDES